jgi:hypothetical protein
MMVQGDVLVDDIRKRYTQMATSGLELDETGNYLIATTQTSSAQIHVNGKIFSLGQSSFLRIGHSGRTWLDRHYESWTRDARVFIGRLWYRIAGDPRDPDEGSGGGGIRG